MSKSKLNVIVIFGGQSGEHEVSVVSANSVVNSLEISRYNIYTIGITKNGCWYWGVKPSEWINSSEKIEKHHVQVTVMLDPQKARFVSINGSDLPNEGSCDVIFPVLHGPKGEDGTIQGLFEMVGFPYVGSGVLGGSLGMDKDRMKAVFLQEGLPLLPYLTVLRSELNKNKDDIVNKISSVLGYPCFIKPANLGSSVGISKADNKLELADALEFAAKYDKKLVIEKGIKGREIELSVLGNDDVIVSIPGEIIPSNDFYDYEAKYKSNDSKLIIPAKLNTELIKLLQSYAKKVFKAVDARGLGRIDFFVTSNGSIYVNEINTMPGFTEISMYPKLWQASGIEYSELLNKLIQLGMENYQDNKNREIN
ncbi:MAG: D-alanine--D-alanine ligase family protein [Eubacteriales bacterium]